MLFLKLFNPITKPWDCSDDAFFFYPFFVFGLIVIHFLCGSIGGRLLYW